MAGTYVGGVKARDKNLSKNPNFYRDIGRKGGKNGRTGGFKSSKVGKDGLTGFQRASVVGTKGGRTSHHAKKGEES